MTHPHRPSDPILNDATVACLQNAGINLNDAPRTTIVTPTHVQDYLDYFDSF